MKKKTLAAASLLLALLMPLGATPLAVYAEEGEGTTQGETSNVNEVSAGTGETEQLKDGEIRIQTALGPRICDNDHFREVMQYALDGSTIELGAGTYSLYKSGADDAWDNMMKGKTFTFVGQSPEKTFWRIGAEEYQNKGGEYDSDYSFKGSQSVTFKKMKLCVPYDKNYLGFSHTNVTVVEDCIIDGRTAYWGYESATFTNTIFNAPTNDNGEADYAIWTYSSPEMTFDNCTFNASGKVINVYTDYDAGKHDITVNFNNCTVNSTEANKTALSINDSLMTKAGNNFKFYVKITGNNTIHGLDPDKVTCSRLFGFGNDKVQTVGGYEYHYDSGATVVTINGKPVWENGQRPENISHNGNTFEGTYDNGTDSGSANQYTEGYKDNKFEIINTTPWAPKADTTSTYVRTITKQCQYCLEKIDEQEEKTGYRLSYDLNGGTGAEGTYNDTYYSPQGSDTATVAAAPSRAGYVFAGWQDAEGKLYAAGETLTVAHDITLTAQWNKLVTVSFDLCGHGGANISSQTFVSGNKASEPTAPKEDGWVFGGWYTEKGCKYRFSFDSAVTSDITLYAKWDRVTTAVSAPVATPTPSPAPAAAPAAAATKTATVKNAAIPQTSDAFPMEGLLALLAVGAVGFGAAGWLRKKHH